MIFVIGAGGQGKVVAEALLLNGCLLRILDGAPSLEGTFLLGMPVESEDRVLLDSKEAVDFFAAVGNGEVRRTVVDRWEQKGHRLVRAIHPSAILSSSAHLGLGVCILAGVVVQADVGVGKGAILNNGVTVDHDCEVGPYAHLAPGVHVAGGVKIGEESWIGIGTSIREGITVGARTVVGAGSVVVRDLPPNVVAYGNPCTVAHPREDVLAQKP